MKKIQIPTITAISIILMFSLLALQITIGSHNYQGLCDYDEPCTLLHYIIFQRLEFAFHVYVPLLVLSGLWALIPRKSYLARTIAVLWWVYFISILLMFISLLFVKYPPDGLNRGVEIPEFYPETQHFRGVE